MIRSHTALARRSNAHRTTKIAAKPSIRFALGHGGADVQDG